MKFKFLNRFLIGLSFVIVTTANAEIIETVPLSYTLSHTPDIGYYSYGDETGEQLIDGEYGTGIWPDDLGNGPAYEWVGWNQSPINIDFTLDLNAVISNISIGTVQDHTGNVVLPNIYVYSRDLVTDSWSLITQELVTESASNNFKHYTYDFSGLNITDQYIRISASFAGAGPSWTFIDEVDFYQETAYCLP